MVNSKLSEPLLSFGLLLPILIGHSRNLEKRISRFHVCAQTIHPPNGMKVLGTDVVAGLINELIFYMNRHDLPQNDAVSADFQGHDFSALQARGRGSDTGNLHNQRRLRFQGGDFNRLDLRRKIDCGEIHGFRDRFVHDIDDKLARVANILSSLFCNRVWPGFVGDADGHDWRVHAHIIESAERRGIELPGRIHARNPRNGPGRDQAAEQTVNLRPVSIRKIEFHNFAGSVFRG